MAIAVGAVGLVVLGMLLTLVVRGLAAAPLAANWMWRRRRTVRQVLTDPVNGYGRDGVTDVRCNQGVNPKVRRGDSFTCSVIVDGKNREVLVEFTDDEGTYAVDRPR